MVKAALLLSAGLWAGAAAAQDAASLGLFGGVPPAEVHYSGQVAPSGTPVRLMFLTEITSRNVVAGQRFKMRVDEPVYINGKAVIPVGTSAWGEITTVDTNGAVGKGGKLAMRILYLDLPGGRLPLKGELDRKGGGNGAGVVLAVVGFGLFGLFTAGDSARFKGGDQVTVYVADAVALPEQVVAAVVAEPAAQSPVVDGQAAPAEAPNDAAPAKLEPGPTEIPADKIAGSTY